MSVFKRRRFPAEIILLCVRWYCRYGISLLIPEQVAHQFRNDVAHLFRDDCAHRSDLMPPTIPG